MPEKRECPAEVARRVTIAGGLNPFGEPMFRVVWGWNRLHPIHGQWSGMHVDVGDGREIDLETPIIETRMEPKYLPADRWHLEMWRPPEDYGSPETWGKLGREVIGDMTVDTSGPFPSRGEYELCYVLSTNLMISGDFLELEGPVVEMLVLLIVKSRKETLTQHQRESAIRQRIERERKARIQETCDALIDATPAFFDKPASMSYGPKSQKSDLWIPPNYRN